MRIHDARAALERHETRAPAMCTCGRPLSVTTVAPRPVCTVAADWWAQLSYWSDKIAELDRAVVPARPAGASVSWWRRLRLG